MRNGFEIIEDNGGGLYIVTFREGVVVSAVGGLEYGDAGEWVGVRDALLGDPVTEVDGWDGQVDNPQQWYDSVIAKSRVVCDSYGVYANAMGASARRYFGVDKES